MSIAGQYSLIIFPSLSADWIKCHINMFTYVADETLASLTKHMLWLQIQSFLCVAPIAISTK